MQEHPDIYYPINYGCIKGSIAPDVEEQDAYILGVDESVEEKWIVASIDKSFSKEEIIEKVYFQEQYFDSYVII